MTQKDKELLLKAIEQKRQEVRPTDTGEMKPATVPNNLELGWLNALAWMKKYIDSLPAEEEQPSKEDSKDPKNDSDHSETLYTYEQINILANNRAQWQKEQTINKACEWLRRCVDVGDEVRMIDGEPEAESFIQKNLHRIEVTNQIIEDFKKAME